MDFYTLCWVFLIYGFLGWCCEVIFAGVNQGKFVNRGFLNGPICPIYGCGMLLVLLILWPLRHRLLLLFIGSVALCTLLEYIVGFLLEKLFHQKWWDYSNYPFNLQGYVCLKFSLLWGLGAMLIVLAVQPPVALLLEKMPRSVGIPILCVLGAVFVADLSVTLPAVLKLPKKFRAMNDLEQPLNRVSCGIGGQLYNGTEKVLEKEEDLRKAYAELAASMNRVQRRVLKAFPNLSENREKLREFLKSRRRKR